MGILMIKQPQFKNHQQPSYNLGWWQTICCGGNSYLWVNRRSRPVWTGI